MPEECLFCKIIKGEQESYKVYEDDNVIAFLDIRPSAPGHTLVVPKKHTPDIQGLPDNMVSDLFSAVKIVMEKIEEALNPDGFNVGWNHGKMAGQAVPHLHVHVLPRFQGDKGGPVQAVVRNEPDEEVSAIANKITRSEKPRKQTGRLEKESRKKGREKDESPQERQLKELDQVPGPASEDLEGRAKEKTPEEKCEEDEEEKEEEEEKDEKHKSAEKKWKEMKKPKY
jgi:histidine triad (HIT) family protein